jgi:hypothetical protein
MHHTNQYYFTRDKLEKLLKKFPKKSAQGSHELTGFVFTPGFNEKYEPAAYVFPVYCKPIKGELKAGKDGDILLQNFSLAGCPYPPKCTLKIDEDDNCYIK